MNRRRILQYAGIAGGLAVVLGVATAAFISLKTPLALPTQSEPSARCTPQPCANVRGYILWVSDVKTEAGLVTMQVRFENSSAATHADPADITLLDSQKNDNQAVFDAAGCTHWPRTEFNGGASFGPVPMCFRPSNTSPPLGVRWTPDFGPFCCETVIALE